MAQKKVQDVTYTQAAVEEVRAALDRVGIVFPSLRLDPASPGLQLVELGRVRADVAVRLARALRSGIRE
ncbi:MAG: hypothetical protein JF597_14915 [Streptomyces sp.]|jgi:hypothetical protein|uniref:hypothetical protein n=1 Tax=Streptomyces sp. TaxID=1931 RepID=UPI0025F0E573|nr:hypothetical protein [Streptomyces sp.]MBW8794843.1 hypothetical protein [Streptomyces sp.]